MMAIRFGLILLVLTFALAMVTTSTSSPLDATMGVATHVSRGDGGIPELRPCNGNVGDCIDEDEEMMMDSESTRRSLAFQRRYVSYSAMKKNSIPCSKRGNSYYHCTSHQRANPYSRGCSRISMCQLCAKSCDVCKHPNLVSKYLEELTAACAFRHRSAASRIYISSSTVLNDDEQISEFWNRDDEASGSEEDISDADDIVDVAKSKVQSSSLSQSRLNDRIELLQHAEESYYRNKVPDKQVNKIDKNVISESLRESSKQRLMNTVKQNQQRFSNLQIDHEASVVMLENECYNKYGKSGKSFYLSQLASTVRWISTANTEELVNRLKSSSPVCKSTSIKSDCSSTSPPPLDGASTEITEEKKRSDLESEPPVRVLQSVSDDTKLPPIPSFSDFINSQKPNDKQPSKSRKHSPDSAKRSLEKRMKYK